MQDNYSDNMQALCEYSMEQLHTFMIDSLGYGEEDLEEWPDKDSIADMIITTNNTAEAVGYLLGFEKEGL